MSQASQARTAELLNTTLKIGLGIILLFLLVLVFVDSSQLERGIIGLGLLLVVLAAYRLLKQQRIGQASTLLLGGFWLAAVHSALFAGGGIHYPDPATYVLYIVVAGALLGGRGALLFAGLNILFRASLFWFDSHGLLPGAPAPPATFRWLNEFIAYAVSAWYLGLTTSGLEKAFRKIQADQTALTHSNQTLQVSEEFMRQITDNVQGLIGYVDTEERFRFANQTYELWFKRPRSQIVGRTIRELLGDEVYLSRQHRQRPLHGERHTFEDTFSYPDGKTRTVLGAFEPHLSADGTVLGFYIFVIDLSERKEAELRNAQLLAEVQAQEQQLRLLNQQVATAQEGERKAVAQELHDGIGQNLTAIGLNLNILRAKVAASPVGAEPLLTRIDDAQQLVQETARQVRSVLRELRPPLLEEEGLVAALRSLAATTTKRTGLAITVRGEEPTPPLSEAVALGLFRVTQEALTNIVKHAHATAATLILITTAADIQLTIGDNGRGLAGAQAERGADPQSWGMLTMRERVRALGGTWQIDSTPAQGTTITVTVAR